MVYPIGSSTGGNCYPLLNTYLSQALQLYNLGLGSFKPMCMFITPSTPGVPGKGLFMRTNHRMELSCFSSIFFFFLVSFVEFIHFHRILHYSFPRFSAICLG